MRLSKFRAVFVRVPTLRMIVDLVSGILGKDRGKGSQTTVHCPTSSKCSNLAPAENRAIAIRLSRYKGCMRAGPSTHICAGCYCILCQERERFKDKAAHQV